MIECFLVDYAGGGYCRDSSGTLYTLDDLPVGAMFLQPVGRGELACYHLPKCDAHLVVMCPGNPVYMWHIDGPSGCSWFGDVSHRCWTRHGEPPSVTVTKGSCPGGAGSISTRPFGTSGRYHGFLYKGVLSDNLIGPSCNPADRATQERREIPNRANTPLDEVIALLGTHLGEHYFRTIVAANREQSADAGKGPAETALRLALSALDIIRSAGDSDEDVAQWFNIPNELLDCSAPPIIAIAHAWRTNGAPERIMQAARRFVEQASPESFDRFIAGRRDEGTSRSGIF